MTFDSEGSVVPDGERISVVVSWLLFLLMALLGTFAYRNRNHESTMKVEAYYHSTDKVICAEIIPTGDGYRANIYPKHVQEAKPPKNYMWAETKDFRFHLLAALWVFDGGC